MRNAALAQVSLVLLAVVVVCGAQPRPLGDPVGLMGQSILQRHSKAARAIRGFKNMALSTARGFGKRAEQPPLPLSQQPSDFEQFDLQIPPQGLPLEWLAEQVQASPGLARALLRRFVDADHDDRLTADELLKEQ